MTDETVLALVAIVREKVEAGHYENYPEGLMECPALHGRECDCGWVEAKAALDAYEVVRPGYCSFDCEACHPEWDEVEE